MNGNEWNANEAIRSNIHTRVFVWLSLFLAHKCRVKWIWTKATSLKKGRTRHRKNYTEAESRVPTFFISVKDMHGETTLTYISSTVRAYFPSPSPYNYSTLTTKKKNWTKSEAKLEPRDSLLQWSQECPSPMSWTRTWRRLFASSHSRLDSLKSQETGHACMKTDNPSFYSR